MIIKKTICKLPKKELDLENEKFTVEYDEDNIFESFAGKLSMELIDELIIARRKALEKLEEDYERGEATIYEIIRTTKRTTKCGKSLYLCKIQLRQPA